MNSYNDHDKFYYKTRYIDYNSKNRKYKHDIKNDIVVFNESGGEIKLEYFSPENRSIHPIKFMKLV